MSPSGEPRRRRVWLAVGIGALLVTFGLWLAAEVETSPLTRSFGGRKPPKVLAGRDLRPEDERRVVREDEDNGFVRCEFDGEGNPGKLMAMGGEEVLTSGPDLSLALPPGRWTVYWESEHGALQLGSIEAEAGAVETCRLTPKGWRVSGTVRNLEGQPVGDARVATCGQQAEVAENGAFEGLARSGSCRVVASYADGMLRRASEPVEVTAFDARGVELVVDDAPIAGMGLEFRMLRGGARVRAVHPGTPAEEAGLLEGDLIVSIDGKPTAGLTNEAFITLGTGREGSRVDLVVERDGERRSFAFHRERIEVVDTG